MSEMIVKVAALCENSMGAPEFLFAQVNLSNDEYSCGAHYELLEQHATEQGYKPLCCFDEHDIALPQVRLLAEFFGQALPQSDVPNLSPGC